MGKEKTKILIADEFRNFPYKKFPQSNFTVKYSPGITSREILRKHPDTNILIIRATRKIDRKLIDGLSLKCVATVSRGTDHIDTGYAKKKKVKIINCNKGNSVSTAEHTIALIICLMRDFKRSFILAGKNFKDTNFRRNELHGKTLGIVGFGNVGKLVYKYSGVFGIKRIVYEIDPSVKSKHVKVNFTTLDYLLRHSDIITIHIPSSVSNKNFFNPERLSKVSKDAVLINTSRGDVIDERGLVRLLKSRKIRAAALDVVQNEEAPDKDLFGVDSLIITNHIAGKTEESKVKMSEEIVLKLKRYITPKYKS